MPMVCRLTSIGLGPFPHYHQLQVVCKVTASYSASSEMEDKRRGLDEISNGGRGNNKTLPTNTQHQTSNSKIHRCYDHGGKNTCGQNKTRQTHQIVANPGGKNKNQTQEPTA